MIVNVIGDCDKRPVIYSLMKIFQTLGDVLLVTNNSYYRRLSDTGESGGHYQNVMLAFTNEGVDDFFEEFRYDYDDFSYVILDNVITGDADVSIHCYSLVDSDNIKEMIEYIDDIKGINIWDNKGVSSYAAACERFEAYKLMHPMPAPIVREIALILAEPLKASAENVYKIGTTIPAGAESVKPQSRPVGPKGGKKSMFPSFGKKGGN